MNDATQTTLTESGEIGVSMSTILKAGLCPACLARIRKIMAPDIQRLELARAHIRGQLAMIEEMYPLPSGIDPALAESADGK